MDELYRDRSSGAAARREELLRRRRAELVTMPHAVRRVVVARASRITAGAVAALGGVALIALSASPAAAAWVGTALPDGRPAPLATVLSFAWIVGALAWAWSRARGEHRFTVAMSRYVLPTDDLDHDVERLDHERPDHVARAIAHDLEVRSAAWPILAAGLVLPATGLWLVHAIRARGWAVSRFEDALALHAGALALMGAIGVVGAIAATRAAVRRPVVAPIAGVLGAILLATAIGGLVARTASWWPWLLASLGGTSLALATIAWRLKRERALLAIADPAAGSELFTLRGLLRAVRAGARVVLTHARATLARIRPRTWALLGSAALVVSTIGLLARSSAPSSAPTSTGVMAQAQARAEAVPAAATAAPAPAAPPVTAPTPAPLATSGEVELTRVGKRVDIIAVLDSDGQVVIPLVPHMDTVPVGWEATIELRLTSRGALLLGGGAATSDVQGVVIGDADPQRRWDDTRKSLVIRACDGPLPLAVRLVRSSSPGAKITFSATPRLTLADCWGHRP